MENARSPVVTVHTCVRSTSDRASILTTWRTASVTSAARNIRTWSASLAHLDCVLTHRVALSTQPKLRSRSTSGFVARSALVQRESRGRGIFLGYVWYKHENTVYEGRLVNRELGQYKGYPLHRNEWPRGIEEMYGG